MEPNSRRGAGFRNHLTEEERTLARKLLARGKSVEKVARHFKVSRQIIRGLQILEHPETGILVRVPLKIKKQLHHHCIDTGTTITQKVNDVIMAYLLALEEKEQAEARTKDNMT